MLGGRVLAHAHQQQVVGDLVAVAAGRVQDEGRAHLGDHQQGVGTLAPSPAPTPALTPALPRVFTFVLAHVLGAGQDRLDRGDDRPVPGQPVSLAEAPPGCAFAARCPHALPRCVEEPPVLARYGDGLAACHRADEGITL